MSDPIAVRIRYRGKLIGDKWVYDHPKIVELPIPYVSRSEKTDEITCDPIGEFPWQDGRKLLDLSGKDGPFEFVEDVYPAIENGVDHPEQKAMDGDDGGNVIDPPKLSMEEIGKLPIKDRPKNRWGNPILTPEERFKIKKRINAAKLKRGERRRALRSDAGKPKTSKADTVVQPQASESPTPETAGV